MEPPRHRRRPAGEGEGVSTLHCPACGHETERLHEGYCEPCLDDRQRALDEHNARFDMWRGMTDQEREQAIKDTVRNG